MIGNASAAAITITDTNLDAVADRKSTRLNSSHSQISYAVFCLKTKSHPLQMLPRRARPSPYTAPPGCRARHLHFRIHLPETQFSPRPVVADRESAHTPSIHQCT